VEVLVTGEVEEILVQVIRTFVAEVLCSQVMVFHVECLVMVHVATRVQVMVNLLSDRCSDPVEARCVADCSSINRCARG